MTARTATAVADELKRWSSELPLADRYEELDGVLRSLDTDRPDTAGARVWASADLFAAFLGDDYDVADAPPLGRVWRVVDTAIQVLVFVPVAVTWFGLAWAAWAYRAALDAGTLRGQSFLQAWQTGFGGRLPDLLTFGNLAICTFSVVSVLILLTALHTGRNRWFAEPRQARLRQKLADALLGVDLILAPYRFPAEERAARELDAAADKVAALVSAFDAATDKMTATAGAVGRAAGKMTASAGAFDTAAGTMTTTVRAVDTAAGSITTAAGAFQAAAGTLTATVGAADSAAGKMTATADAFDTAAQTMTAATGKATTMVKAAEGAAGTMTGTAAAFDAAAAALTGTVGAAAAAAGSMTTSAHAFDTVAGALTRTVGAVDTAAGNMAGTARAFDTAAGSMTTTADRIAHTVGVIDGAAATISTSASAIQSVGQIAVDTQQKATDSITAVNATLATAQDTVRAAAAAITVLEGVSSRLGGHVDDLATATAQVTRAEQDLADASGKSAKQIADALGDGTTELRDKLDELATSATYYAHRVEVAADVLKQAHEAITGLPPAVAALHNEVRLVGGQLSNLQQVTPAVADLKVSLQTASTASDRMALALTDGSGVVRDFLTQTSITAAENANRVQAAAHILRQAQQAIDTLPGSVNALADEVTRVSGQLTNLADVVTAVGELRDALDRVRDSYDGAQRAAPKPPRTVPRRTAPPPDESLSYATSFTSESPGEPSPSAPSFTPASLGASSTYAPTFTPAQPSAPPSYDAGAYSSHPPAEPASYARSSYDQPPQAAPSNPEPPPAEPEQKRRRFNFFGRG